MSHPDLITESIESQHQMIELDGPKTAYVEVDTGTRSAEGISIVLRVLYRTLSISARTPTEAVMLGNKLLNLVRRTLYKPDGPTTMLWWRRRPELSKNFETDSVVWCCRLGTIPAIPEDKWNELCASVVQFEEPVGFKGGGGWCRSKAQPRT